MSERILDQKTKEEIYRFMTLESHIRDNPDRLAISLGVSLMSDDTKDRATAERVILHYDHLARESEDMGKPWWYCAALLTLLEARNCDIGDEYASDPRSNVAQVEAGRVTGKNGLRKKPNHGE